MKLKWYLSALVIALTLLGVGQYQITVPNQEIVVQFTDEVSSDVSQDAFLVVKAQLQSLGANNIQVHNENGSLRITYYSNIDVVKIKNLLSKNNLKLDYSSSIQNNNKSNNPLEDNTNSFNLDVFEIQEQNSFDLDYDGFVLEQKPENPRFYSPNLYVSNDDVDNKERHKIEGVKFLAQRNIAIAIDNTSHKIPEVRAGPKA